MAAMGVPRGMGVQAMWMNQALLVALLAEAGQEGAEAAVPGATLFARGTGRLPLLVT